ncbi:MAG TPA: hypothetical protein PLI09_11270 [Candidatus Hydrogenedentes bacterium]|nr:hypothetical protein [Candidatus Hydrogenedentota bacterium]
MSQANVNFDIGSMISESWNIFKNNAGPLIGGFVVASVIVLVGGMIPIIGMVIPIVIMGPFMLGIFKMARSAVAGQPVEFSDIFSGFQKFLPAFLAYLVITIFTMIGMIFCILPGLFVSMLYLPTYLFILNDNLDFWPAMEASRKMVMNNVGQWILLYLVFLGLNLLGVMACCVGIFVTGPIMAILIVLAFNMERNAVQPVIPPVPPAEPTE